MNPAVRGIIEFLHSSPLLLSACVCGAGFSAISQLTQVAGCSKTLLHAELFYSVVGTAHSLDYAPQSMVTLPVARQLGQQALRHSKLYYRSPLDTEATPAVLIGVGSTSAVKTMVMRRGRDQAYVSVWVEHVSRPSQTPVAATAVNGDLPEASALKNARGGASAQKAVYDFHMNIPCAWDRYRQDEHVAMVILYAICRTAQQELSWKLDLSPLRDLLDPVAPVEGGPEVAAVPMTVTKVAELSHTTVSARDPIREAIQFLLDGKTTAVLWNRFGDIRCDVVPYAAEDFPKVQQPVKTGGALFGNGAVRLLFPGSFRPLHWGHSNLARAALRVIQQMKQLQGDAAAADADAVPVIEDQVTYEISAVILDKGRLSVDDLAPRVEQFLRRGARVVITAAGLFREKAALFPGHGFIIGVDTARRIVDTRYYGKEDMVEVLLREIGGRGCYFIVGGRTLAPKADMCTEGNPDAKMTSVRHEEGTTGGQTWVDLSSINIPEPLRHLFISIPESEFHIDISSTELRARKGIK